VLNIFSSLHGWLTVHQNSKTYLSLYTTFLTVCNTKTNKSPNSTLLPLQLRNQQLRTKWTSLGTKQKHCFVSLFYPTIQFKLRIEETLLRSCDHALQKLDHSNWIHLVNWQRSPQKPSQISRCWLEKQQQQWLRCNLLRNGPQFSNQQNPPWKKAGK